MHHDLLRVLACPDCFGALSLHITNEGEGEIESGDEPASEHNLSLSL
jgi:uncharacterized protein YbaR (Trm112 family)